MLRNALRPKYLIPAILFSLAVALFPIKGVAPSADSSWYLNSGFKIYENCDSNNIIIWRPLFPIMMAASFHIFGPSVQSGFYVVRLFFVLNVILAYFLGLRFFDRPTGVVFSLFILTSLTINKWSSYLLLDNILPFFVMIYILLIYLSFESSKYIFFISSGVILGMSILLKPVASVMYILLPVSFFIYSEYRTRKNGKGVGLIYLSFFLVISPWIYHIVFDCRPVKMLLGPLVEFDKITGRGLIPSAGDASDLATIWTFISGKVMNLNKFMYKYIFKESVLSPVMIFGFFYSAYQSIFRKNSASSALLFSVLLFFPIIYVVSQTRIRVGQLMILYFLLYLMAAHLIVNALEQLAKSLKLCPTLFGRRICLPKMAMAGVALICISWQGIATVKDMSWTKNHAFSFWKGQLHVGGWANESVREAAEWITENIPEDTKILSQWRYLAAMKFFTQDKYKIEKLGPVKLLPKKIAVMQTNKLGRPISIWPRHSSRTMKRNYLEGVFETQLLRRINEKKIRYVLITEHQDLIGPYLDYHQQFIFLSSFADGEIKIYRVSGLPVRESEAFELGFDPGFFSYLRRLHNEGELRWREEIKMLETVLGWSDKEMNRFSTFIEEGDEVGFLRRYGQLAYVEKSGY